MNCPRKYLADLIQLLTRRRAEQQNHVRSPPPHYTTHRIAFPIPDTSETWTSWQKAICDSGSLSISPGRFYLSPALLGASSSWIIHPCTPGMPEIQRQNSSVQLPKCSSTHIEPLRAEQSPLPL